MPTQNRMSLQTAVFNPAPFQPVAFTPQAADVSILGNSLRNIEQRENTYNEKMSALDAAFSQMRETLPNDDETLQWFDEYQQKYKDKVKAFADNYDYGTAINMAVRAGGEAVSSAEYTGRKRYYAERKEWVDALEKRTDLKPREKDYWKRHYPQKYEDIKDSTGKIIGGNHFEAPTPVKAIDWEEAIESADKNVAEDVQGKGSSSSYTSDYGGHSSGSSKVVKKKPFSKLVQGLKEYMRKNQDVREQFNVAYDMMNDDYKDLIANRDKYEVGSAEYIAAQKEIDLFLEEIGSENGGFPDKAEWLDWNVKNSQYAKLHSYENVNTETQSAKSDETKGSAVVRTQVAEEEAAAERERKRRQGNVTPEQGKSRHKTINIGGVEVIDFTDYTDENAG